MKTTVNRNDYPSRLNMTELDILAALRAGKTDRQICDDLGISRAEFAGIRRTALRKLDAKTREELLSRALTGRRPEVA